MVIDDKELSKIFQDKKQLKAAYNEVKLKQNGNKKDDEKINVNNSVEGIFLTNVNKKFQSKNNNNKNKLIPINKVLKGTKQVNLEQVNKDKKIDPEQTNKEKNESVEPKNSDKKLNVEKPYKIKKINIEPKNKDKDKDKKMIKSSSQPKLKLPIIRNNKKLNNSKSQKIILK